MEPRMDRSSRTSTDEPAGVAELVRAVRARGDDTGGPDGPLKWSPLQNRVQTLLTDAAGEVQTEIPRPMSATSHRASNRLHPTRRCAAGDVFASSRRLGVLDHRPAVQCAVVPHPNLPGG